MWVEEGFVGFMRGNGTNVIRIVPYSAVQFASYEQFKKVRRAISSLATTVCLQQVITGSLITIDENAPCHS